MMEQDWIGTGILAVVMFISGWLLGYSCNK
jgi:hypothetical protein